MDRQDSYPKSGVEIPETAEADKPDSLAGSIRFSPAYNGRRRSLHRETTADSPYH